MIAVAISLVLLLLLYVEIIQTNQQNAGTLSFRTGSSNKTDYNFKPPHIFYINLDAAVKRKIDFENHVNQLGYNFTRVSAFTTDEVVVARDALPSGSRGKNNLKLFAVTSSHLECIYQAILAYRENRIAQEYALVVEDDVRILYKDIDWESMIKVAPANWTILQIVTSNVATIISLFDVFEETNSFWHIRSKNHAWSTGGYLVNTKTMGHWFDSKMTKEERADRRVRLNQTETFILKCSKIQLSTAQRLRCGGKIKFFADKFIYELGSPNVHISTLPVLIFLGDVSSEISSNHMRIQVRHDTSINVSTHFVLPVIVF